MKMAVLPSSLGYFDVTLFIVLILIILLMVRLRRPKGCPPGPTPLPVIGNVYNLAKGDMVEVFRNLRQKYGDIFSLSLGPFWVIVVNGADNLRELLVKRAEFTSDRPQFYLVQIFDNKGIAAASGLEWKQQRTFALSKLRDFGFGRRSFESRIMEEAEVFFNLLESYHGEPLDISGIVNISMSNIVMSISIGRRFDYEDPEFKTFIGYLNENVKNVAVAGVLNFMPFLAKLPGDLFKGKKTKLNIDATMNFLRNKIKEHEESFDENNIRDFIDIYLKEMKGQHSTENNIFTDQQLLCIIGDLFAAGTETTATAIKWAVMFLMNYPDVQRKMRKEIDDTVGSGRHVSMSDKPNLPYCEAVILESLRLGNIVPFSLPHLVSDDISIKGYTLPKGSVIFPVLDSVAHDEELFPDNNEFNPERFLDTNGKVCGQEKLLTFSLGRRVCLGESLARMELFLYLTSMVQRFEFLPPEGQNPPPIKGVLGLTYGPAPYTFRAVSRR